MNDAYKLLSRIKKYLLTIFLLFNIQILMSCSSVDNENVIIYQNKITNETCRLILPFPIKEKAENQFFLSDDAMFQIFNYRKLSSSDSSRQRTEELSTRITNRLKSMGYQLLSSEDVVYGTWSGLLLKLKSEEISWNIWLLHEDHDFICFGFTYLSFSPMKNLNEIVSKILHSFSCEFSPIGGVEST